MASASFITIVGALLFKSKGLRMPADYNEPQSIRDLYMRSLDPNELPAIPRLFPPLYDPALPVGPHQLACDTIGRAYYDMLKLACEMTQFGLDQWRLQAKFGPMTIAAAVVIGTPGCVLGPPLDGLMKMHPEYFCATPAQLKYLDAVASGVSQAFSVWQSGVTVPGLPFFPAYIMQPPGPAIPMPNVPFPLIACLSGGLSTLVTPSTVKGLMMGAFGKFSPSDEAFFDALATVLSLGFVVWLGAQIVTTVLGAGAVASPVGGPVTGVTLPGAHFLA